ncbi:MAG: RlmE family RNA methyltransferase [Hydrotalea sp.]|nr:RlmE family RNA methyltransferase [Hydrotalea sp.]
MIKVENRKLKSSSRAWVERQLHDPYVKQAKDMGYRARSAFKLLEIDKKCRLLNAGQAVVDLGAAPGGWSQVLRQKINNDKKNPAKIIAIDLLAMDPIPDVEFILGDFTRDESQSEIIALLGGKKLDGVLSDMAMNTTGHQSTDHLRTLFLAEQACDFAIAHLAPGGFFVTKVFQGGASGGLLQRIKKSFTTVKHIKPDSSRKESPEVYLVAQHYRR